MPRISVTSPFASAPLSPETATLASRPTPDVAALSAVPASLTAPLSPSPVISIGVLTPGAAIFSSRRLARRSRELSPDVRSQQLLREAVPSAEPPNRIRIAQIVRSGPSDALAITIDDCYNIPGLRRILDVMRRHSAHATFFCIGRHLERHPEFVRQLVADGHELGNHTYSHVWLTRLKDREAIEAELNGWQRVVDKALGAPYPTRWFRPPGMAGFSPRSPIVQQEVFREILGERGLNVALWSVDLYSLFFRPTPTPSVSHPQAPQAQGPSPDLGGIERARSLDTTAIVAYLRRRIRGGEIILFHPHPVELEALVQLLPEWAPRYRLVTLSEMFPDLRPLEVPSTLPPGEAP